MKQFDIPSFYKSSFISRIKNSRKVNDPKKKDFTPALLDFGPVKFYIARHFGFCYGVENAIDISNRIINENPAKRIFLLSEMIHNPGVNSDLLSRGVKFLMDTSGKRIFNWDQLTKDDIIIIPAFGTTLEIESELKGKGLDPYKYNTTCPFVEKVWNRSTQLGNKDYTIIIHGKHNHEETRATFSHSANIASSLIIRDIKEAKILCSHISDDSKEKEFHQFFKGKYSPGFDFHNDLKRIGVVNQTTMLASETEEIAELLKNTLIKKYGARELNDHFADTRDTLCYATNDNQDSTYGLLNVNADLAIVVGGYNSSNTTHIVELCEKKFKTYFITSAEKLLSKNLVNHFDLHSKKEILNNNFIPETEPVSIILTSGASCPDAVVDLVLRKIISFFPHARDMDLVLKEFE
jgi:4-hydroxy-3-methylbut-2-en-1-yl diphosphate reductase